MASAVSGRDLLIGASLVCFTRKQCVSCYAGNARAQPNKRYIRQAYFLLGI